MPFCFAYASHLVGGFALGAGFSRGSWWVGGGNFIHKASSIFSVGSDQRALKRSYKK